MPRSTFFRHFCRFSRFDPKKSKTIPQTRHHHPHPPHPRSHNTHRSLCGRSAVTSPDASIYLFEQNIFLRKMEHIFHRSNHYDLRKPQGKPTRKPTHPTWHPNGFHHGFHHVGRHGRRVMLKNTSRLAFDRFLIPPSFALTFYYMVFFVVFVVCCF